MKPSFLLKGISLFIISAFFTIAAFGQSDGRISGRIVDSNGAAVPGATVKLTDEATNQGRNITATNDGTFVIPALKASHYTIEVSASNFGASKKTGIELLAGQPLDLEFTLGAQGVSVSVDIVSGEDSIANTSSAAMSANVNQREIENLPLNGRQLSQLALQAPGAQNTGSGTFVDLRFNGRANEQNAVRYDGVEGSAIISASPGDLNGETPTPFRLQSSLENVQEFRVDSSNFPAELGTGTGGQISVVTKSGANQFHGSAFEYLRRASLDAANFFDNLSPIGLKKSPLQLDQFGGSIGGPIIKNKLFFFGSYEQYRGRFGLNILQAAPALSLAAPGAIIPGSITAANPAGTLVNSAIQPYIAAFRAPGSVVLPNVATSLGFESVLLQAPEKTDEKSFAVRFDYQATNYNKFYVRFFRDQGRDIAPNGVSGANIQIDDIPQNGIFDWQSIIRKDGSLINDFKFGYNSSLSRITGQAPIVNGLDFTGISLNIGGTVAVQGLPGQGTASGVSSPGGLIRANSAQNGRGQPYTPYTLSYIDSLSWIKGNHSIKFGGELRQVRLYTDRLGGTTYTFSSLNNFLTNTLASVQYLGDVSGPDPFTTGPGGIRFEKSNYYIAYAQDEWKLRPGLTFSYGLRYEYYSPLREAHDQQVLFNIDTGTLKDPSSDPYKSSKNNFGPRVAVTWSPDQGGDGFFGGGKTVVRGGFGIYYGPGQTEDQVQPIDSDRASSTITGPTCSTGGTTCGATGVQLFAFPAPVLANSATISDFFKANPNTRSYQPRAYSNNYEVPERIYQYSFSWQQQLPYKVTSTVAYVGSKGRNLFLRSVANQFRPGQTTIVDGTPLPTNFGIVNRTGPTGQVIGVSQIRQFSIIPTGSTSTVQNPFAEIDYKTSGGRDSYNALQVSIQRNLSTGLTMNAQYTYGSSKGTSAGSNEARTSAQLENFEADYGRNNFDVRHNFNFSALYELPFGKGRHFSMGKTADLIAGGWQLGGIVNARSGVPVEVLIVRPDVVIQCQLAAGCPNGTATPFANGFTAQLPAFNGTTFPALPTGFIAVSNTPGGGASRNVRRPDLIPGVDPFASVPGVDRSFINPAAFAAPAAGQFGNLTRNALSGPSFKQLDITLAKRFKFTETMNFQFRAEFFNILNTANFGNPGTTLNLALPTLTCVTPGGGTCASYTASALNFQPGTAYTQGAAGSTFGVQTSTVNRTVGLGANRQIQLAFRFNF
ncbi:MAG: carboxypeptidase regulatory-like domain-containing protein [Acidobacteriota bacterium]